jgi:hypothetical protein
VDFHRCQRRQNDALRNSGGAYMPRLRSAALMGTRGGQRASTQTRRATVRRVRWRMRCSQLRRGANPPADPCEHCATEQTDGRQRRNRRGGASRPTNMAPRTLCRQRRNGERPVTHSLYLEVTHG